MIPHHQRTRAEHVTGGNVFMALGAAFADPGETDASLQQAIHGGSCVSSGEQHLTGLEGDHLAFAGERKHGVESVHGSQIVTNEVW